MAIKKVIKKGLLPDAESYDGEPINNVDEEEEVTEEKSCEITGVDAIFNPSSVNGVTNDDEADDETGAKFKPEDEETVEKVYRVKLNADYRGCIGGKRLYFKKDEVYTVDQNIKRILNKSNLLKPLS